MALSQFKADVDLLTTADNGQRDVNKLLWGVFHTSENDDGTPPQNVARWQQDESNESSYNVLFGTRGLSVRGNDDNYAPWAAGYTGNLYGVHGSAIGRAARTRAQWLQFPQQIESMARWAADLNKRYRIPLVKLTVAQVRAKKRGFCGHLEISKAFGEVNHTDPGDGFPWDVVLTRAKEINATRKNKPSLIEKVANKVANKVDSKGNKLLNLILDQLVGHPWPKWPGWPQLGHRSLVDAIAAIGAALNVPGMYDPQKEQRADDSQKE